MNGAVPFTSRLTPKVIQLSQNINNTNINNGSNDLKMIDISTQNKQITTVTAENEVVEVDVTNNNNNNHKQNKKQEEDEMEVVSPMKFLSSLSLMIQENKYRYKAIKLLLTINNILSYDIILFIENKLYDSMLKLSEKNNGNTTNNNSDNNNINCYVSAITKLCVGLQVSLKYQTNLIHSHIITNLIDRNLH